MVLCHRVSVCVSGAIASTKATGRNTSYSNMPPVGCRAGGGGARTALCCTPLHCILRHGTALHCQATHKGVRIITGPKSCPLRLFGSSNIKLKVPYRLHACLRACLCLQEEVVCLPARLQVE